MAHYELISSENQPDFANQNTDAKKELASIIKYLTREARRLNLDYFQLRSIFQQVRNYADIQVPKQRQRLPELPTDQDLQRFYGVMNNASHKLIFQFLEGTGVRVSELCNLEVNQINFKANTAFIKEGKGSKDRVIVFGNNLKEKLLIYLQGRNQRFLFESNRCSGFTTRRIEQLAKQYKEKAKIEKSLHPHIFRHKWNTRLAEKGISKDIRALLAGHSKDGRAQEIYTHLGVAGIKDDVIKVIDSI